MSGLLGALTRAKWDADAVRDDKRAEVVGAFGKRCDPAIQGNWRSGEGSAFGHGQCQYNATAEQRVTEAAALS